MKKIVITILLLLLSSSMYADMFDSNTDMKNKYKFDEDVSLKNAVLAKKLEKFQSGEASEEEIQRYLDLMADSKEKPFADDIQVDSIFVRVDENATNEDKNWFSSLYSSWFGAEEVPAEETPTEEVPAEETPTEEVPVEETPAEEVPVEETPAEEVPVEETPTERVK